MLRGGRAGNTPHLVENVDELRQVELVRLDALQASLWPQAMSGDARAANTILRIIDYRTRLLGLADQRTTEDLEGPSRWLVDPRLEGNPGEATDG
jgi:hypothetical protein